jgi:hypothetical protein
MNGETDLSGITSMELTLNAENAENGILRMSGSLNTKINSVRYLSYYSRKRLFPTANKKLKQT